MIALSIYGIDSLTEDSFATVETSLIARRKQWLDKQLEKSSLNKGIAGLTLQIQHQNQQLSERAQELENQHTDYATLLAGQEALKRERKALFDDKDPVLEESLLSEAIVSSENPEKPGRSINKCRRGFPTAPFRMFFC